MVFVLKQTQEGGLAAHFSMVLSNAAQINTEKIFNLNMMQGKVVVTNKVIVPPLETVQIKGIKGHWKKSECHHRTIRKFSNSTSCQCIHIFETSIISNSCMCMGYIIWRDNYSSKKEIGQIGAANVIPTILAPKEPSSKDKNTDIPKDDRFIQHILGKVYLCGTAKWDPKHQWLFEKEFIYIFLQNDLDLRKMSLVKLKINLTDETSFKGCYKRIPPSMYNAVKNHFHMMLDIGAIWPSQSPWMSPVVLIRKKRWEIQVLCWSMKIK